MTSIPTRRTQAERRATTRARILDCAAECLLEVGYPGTTITQVQQRAGLARGTVQHHFPTRHELVTAVVAHVAEARLEQFRRSAASVPADSDRLQALVDLAWQDLNSRDFFTVLELWVAARTDAALRDRLVAEEGRFFAEIGTVYAELLSGSTVPMRHVETLVQFTIDFLTGLSMTTMLTGQLGERERLIRRWKRALTVLSGTLPASQLIEGATPEEKAIKL